MEHLFPTGETLLALEKETLRKILNTGAFTDSDFRDVVNNANSVYRSNVNSQSSSFAFHCHFRVLDNEDVRRVDVGARIILNDNGTYNEVSYFFSISGTSSNENHILRKVHFDFEPIANRNLSEAKPSLHFQIAGTLPPRMVDDGFQDSNLEHLAPWYEKPRIPCLPFSLAILFDVLFHEFRSTEHVHDVLEDSTWRSIVNEAEMKMIYPYMQGCAEFLGRANRNKLFTSHFLYGLSR